MRRNRAVHAVGIVAVTSALVLTGCTAPPAEPDPDEPVTLTMSWWGNDTRSANTQRIIDAFVEDHPNVTIEPSFTDYNGYWDRLATQTVGGDTPDIMQFDEPYLSTYVRQGVLLDLTDLGIDTSGISDSALSAGQVDDRLYALASGAAAYAIFVNPALFDAAGIEVPSDPEWTWEEFTELAAELSAASGGAYSGFSSTFGFDEGSFKLWVRQHGEHLFTAEGEIGASADTVASYFEFVEELIETGAAPSASALVESFPLGLAETAFATGRSAMGTFFNSQVTAVSAALGNEVVVLPLPESVDDYFVKPASFWVGSARTEHPEVVAEFIDFMVNSETQADIQGTERGIPNNEDIRAYLAPDLSETDQQAIAFFDEIELGDAEAVTPPGGNQFVAIMQRYTQEVIFGTTDAEDAAARFLDELQGVLDNA